MKNPEVEAKEACPGLLDAAAAEALIRVLGSGYLVSDDGQAVGAAAMTQAVQDVHPEPVCLTTGQVGSGSRVGEIRLRPGPLDDTGVGVRVVRRENSRGVSFDCTSSRIRFGGTLRVTATFEDQVERGSRDPKLGNDYLVIAHSAARGIAKELGCQNGGGIPEQVSALPAD
ncbi:hypothetical protein [Streptomyces sp. NPDC059411]|uniref:hypothetical protein n=1 Tax=Streptomyces sp. NPDC059411 TaxID=3346825 RepID=UPI00367C2B15